MPTWRQWIVTASYKKAAGPAKTAFTQSEYFRFYRSLLSDRRLAQALEHFGVDLEFFPTTRSGRTCTTSAWTRPPSRSPTRRPATSSRP